MSALNQAAYSSPFEGASGTDDDSSDLWSDVEDEEI